MSYNENRDRNGMRDDTSYTGWIIGGVVAIALIIGLFAMFGRDRTNTASDDANRPAATADATSERRNLFSSATNRAGDSQRPLGLRACDSPAIRSETIGPCGGAFLLAFSSSWPRP